MHDAYILHPQRAYPEATIVDRPPFRPSYTLAYARPATTWYMKHPYFSLIHQAHDARHSYVSALEVDANRPISLPLASLHSDLHHLYALQGAFTLHPWRNAKGSHFAVYAGYYGQVYSPAGQQGALTVSKGRHLLVGLVIEWGWQARYRTSLHGVQQALLNRLRTKGHQCHASHAYPMSHRMRITVAGLLGLPLLEGMAMDHAIDGYAVQLDELHRSRHLATAIHSRTGDAPSGSYTDPLTDAIKLGIQQEIDAQRYPSVAKLAADLHRSRQTLHHHFAKHAGQSIKTYITDAVMAVALQLLRETPLPIAAIAFRLGYREQASFNHQFKAYYGATPAEAREAPDAPKPRKNIPLTK
ncbi:helix-turn-helix transcriptional regulator [Parapedobacter sp. ISTM3]|uniref:helix-turn-helix transcriptional regulator n=1 Tax=Parapedobacter sp. ISTM3 TaxID=2800130 RepID=UPI00190634F2|nr:helix-turn-helix transcriptional regulator [Parapedobacter sp. ISTM3]MBK1442583.1 helix-turn-helix transcriptional regulator [Parapedobacter sp. ISTM3]